MISRVNRVQKSVEIWILRAKYMRENLDEKNIEFIQESLAYTRNKAAQTERH